MAEIGFISFLSLQGALNTACGELLTEITRPGVDGVAYRREGRRGEASRLQTAQDFSSADDAAAHVEACQLLQGSIVDIVDDHGREWTSYIIIRATHSSTQAIHGRVGGSGFGSGYLVRMAWVVRATEGTS